MIMKGVRTTRKLQRKKTKRHIGGKDGDSPSSNAESIDLSPGNIDAQLPIDEQKNDYADKITRARVRKKLTDIASTRKNSGKKRVKFPVEIQYFPLGFDVTYYPEKQSPNYHNFIRQSMSGYDREIDELIKNTGKTPEKIKKLKKLVELKRQLYEVDAAQTITELNSETRTKKMRLHTSRTNIQSEIEEIKEKTEISPEDLFIFDIILEYILNLQDDLIDMKALVSFRDRGGDNERAINVYIVHADSMFRADLKRLRVFEKIVENRKSIRPIDRKESFEKFSKYTMDKHEKAMKARYIHTKPRKIFIDELKNNPKPHSI